MANFHTDSAIPTDAFQKGLNSKLPRDIVVCSVTEVDTDFHSRFTATSRRYRYTILNRAYPTALLRQTCLFIPTEIDVVLADAICKSIIGEWNFSSFQKTGSDRLNPVCVIMDACCWKTGEYIHFEIEADSFLRGMVRAIVGTILKCIRHATDDVDDICIQFHDIINAKDRSLAGPSVPAHGLSLIQVKYNL